MSIMNGFNIIEDKTMVDTVQDWSQCRSRSRAERRLRQGHKQKMKYIDVPKQHVFILGNSIVMHPELAAKFKNEVIIQSRHDTKVNIFNM